MRTGLVLVAALMGCGGDEMRPTVEVAGKGAEDAGRPGSGKPDAGHDSGTDAQPTELGGSGGSDEPEAGSGGTAGEMPSGGAGRPAQGGAGAGGQGGSEAPQERVLWSKDFAVTVDSAIGYGAEEGDQMGVRIETDKFGCTVGDEPQPSGTTREYVMDASCLTTFAKTTPLSAAVLFYRADGESAGLVKRYELDWTGVEGNPVTKLRRTQTWSIDRLCETETKCWNLADFAATWEVIGY